MRGSRCPVLSGTCVGELETPCAPQILFLSGVTLIIGPSKTFYFFARKQKLRGTVCFIGGILLVFFKWPFIGVIVETFGFLNLFGCVYFLHHLSSHPPPFRSREAVLYFYTTPYVMPNLTMYACRDFFPVILTFLRQLPIIGQVLSLPYIGGVRIPSDPACCLPFEPTYGCSTGGGPHCRLKDLDCIMTIDRRLAFISRNIMFQVPHVGRRRLSLLSCGAHCAALSDSACETSPMACCETWIKYLRARVSIQSPVNIRLHRRQMNNAPAV